MFPKIFGNGFDNSIFINLFHNISKYLWKYFIKNHEIFSIFLSNNQFEKWLRNISKFYEMAIKLIEFVQ